MSAHGPSHLSRRVLAGASTIALATTGLAAHAQPFSYLPAGDLINGSGDGRADETVYAPGMRFPIEQGPAYANSQVYMNGGMYGPGGGQCDAVNYSYPWRDNYCETRTWDMPLCPAGVGHQGQDMRPATCENSVYWCVATTDGTITNVGTYSVYLTAADGTRYDYLHMSNVQVSVGSQVTRGQQLGRVSNQFGGTPTTIHLHFNIRQFVDGVGDVYVPPYMSLVQSYATLMNQPTVGTLDQADCTALSGWTRDPDLPGESIEVRLAVDGPLDDPAAASTQRLATADRPDVCDGASPCPHGFAVSPPMRMFDGAVHEIRAWGVDSLAGPTELTSSPATASCDPLELDGIRRPASQAALDAWSVDLAWDSLQVSAAALDSLETGEDLGTDPTLVTNTAASALWLLDEGLLRPIPDDATLLAWRLDLPAAETWTDDDLAAQPLGPPLRPRPIVLSATGTPGSWYLLDDEVSATGPLPTDPTGTGADPSAAGVPGANDGCSCRSAPPRPSAPSGLLTLLAGAALLARTRRRRVAA